jgi:hypothetical protein
LEKGAGGLNMTNQTINLPTLFSKRDLYNTFILSITKITILII